MHSIDSYVWREPGCEIELPDIGNLKGSDCIITTQAPHKNTIAPPSLLPTREAAEPWLMIQTISPHFRSKLLVSQFNAMQKSVYDLNISEMTMPEALNTKGGLTSCDTINYTRRINNE